MTTIPQPGTINEVLPGLLPPALVNGLIPANLAPRSDRQQSIPRVPGSRRPSREILGRATAQSELAEAAERARADQARAEVIEAARRKLWKERGRRYRQASLTTFAIEVPAQREVLSAIRTYARDLRENIEAGKNIVLVGPPGTGKDHLMAALFDAAFDAGYVVRWVSGPKLFAGLREAIHEGTGDAAAIRPYLTADVLALSDPIPVVGGLTGYQSSCLYEIVDGRYSDLRPVWATLNAAGAAEAEEKVGPAIIDRLRDGALSLALNWPSYRKSSQQ